LTENFAYDALNRLTGSTVSSSGAGVVNEAYAYNDIGNLITRPDGGALTYPASGSGSVRPHAVSQVTTSAGNYVSYGYDANGNQPNYDNQLRHRPLQGSHFCRYQFQHASDARNAERH
jgi:hypothetical protein